MPYFFKSMLKTPLDQEHLWDRFREIWNIVDRDLRPAVIQTKQQAVDRAHEPTDPNDFSDLKITLVRYRQSDDRLNLRLHYLRGLKALEKTETGIRQQQLTPEFLNNWTILMECHGALVTAMMAPDDDLLVERNRQNANENRKYEADRRRRWIAHVIKPLLSDFLRKEIDPAIGQAFVAAITHGPLPIDCPGEWLKQFIKADVKPDVKTDVTLLRSAYCQQNLPNKEVEELVTQPKDDLPPI